MGRPSTAHQTLVMWAVRKIQADGFVPVACDGIVPQLDCQRLLRYPPNLRGLRPDAIAFSPQLSKFAFAEAKTEDDIGSEHTKLQLSRYAALIGENGLQTGCVYISIPRSASMALDGLLRDVGLLTAKQIRRLHIPDCLIADWSAAHA